MADSEKDRLEKILDKNAPAALIGICIKPDAATVKKYLDAGAPVILIDEEMEGASTVTTDNFTGGFLAGEHLAKSGRKKIGSRLRKDEDRGRIQRDAEGERVHKGARRQRTRPCRKAAL